MPLKKQFDKDKCPIHYAVQNGIFNSNDLPPRLSPKMSAAKTGDDILVKFLIDHHADASIRDEAGYTPLHIAAEKGHYTIVKLLCPITEERNTGVMVKQQPRPRGPFVLTEIPVSTPHDLALHH